MPESDDLIAAELDARHTESERAFEHRDLDAYRQILSPDLRYTQADGETIDRDQLTSYVRRQFSRFRRVGSSYEREALEVHSPERVTETVTQTAWAEESVFLVFKQRWEIVRRGEYTWERTSDGWRILAVSVLQETVSRGQRGSRQALEPAGPGSDP